jgi:ubiquinone/menaquinone biosynthesis C-methylase UbiE
MTRGKLTASEVKAVVRQHWSDRAPTYDQSASHNPQTETQHRAWLALLRQLVGAQPLAVLDVGCGTGTLSLLLAELGHRVTGIDLSAEMLARAQEKAQARRLSVAFHLGDAEALDLPDASFDVVVERHLIWTLPDPVAAVQEWCRVLRPGGRLILIEGHWESQHPQPAYEKIQHWLPFYGGKPQEQLEQFLTVNGLCEVRTEPLMAAALWGEEPLRPRYAIVARCK